eukprot:scaffold19527_cov61-Phaeocystis_antarctica.AAC.2
MPVDVHGVGQPRERAANARLDDAVAHRADLPCEQAQADRTVLAREEGDGNARVEAFYDQILRCRLEKARELAAAQRGVAFVRENHTDARGARGAHLIGQLATRRA